MTTTPIERRNPAQLRNLLLTTLLLLVAAAVLILGTNALHMRPDEHLTFQNMQYSFDESMTRLATRNNQAPLWWINTWVWQRVAGTTEYANRLNSVLLSLLTLSVVYQIGRSWFGMRRVGWFALLLLSANAYFFIYALEMRMYALAILLTVLSMRFFYAWVTRRRWRDALVYGVTVAAMLYTHYYLGFVVLVQIAYFIVFHLWRFNWRLIGQGVAAGALATLVWSPGIFLLYGQLAFIDFAEEGGLKIPTQPTNLETLVDLVQLAGNGWAWLYGSLIVFGIVRLWRNRAYWLVLFWLLMSPGLVLLINIWAPIFTQRYTSFFAPAIALAAAAPLATLALPKGQPVRRSVLLRWAGVMLVFGLILTSLPGYAPVRTPWRLILGTVSEQAQPGDVLLFSTIELDGYKLDQMARYLPPELVANRVETAEEAAEARRVWFLNDAWFNEEVRADFETIEATHRVFSVAGDCTSEWCMLAQLLVAPPNREAITFGGEIGFLGADADWNADGALQVLLWWTVDEPPQRDYSISLQALDANGALVAQDDGAISPPGSDETVLTSQMVPGGSYLDERILSLPANNVQGEITVQLIVYDWQTNKRLTTSQNHDSIILQNISSTLETQAP